MITQTNYFENINRYGVDKLPEGLKLGHEIIDEQTKGGSNWETNIKELNELIALQLKKFNKLMGNKTTPTSKPKVKANPSVAKATTKKAEVAVKTVKKAIAKKPVAKAKTKVKPVRNATAPKPVAKAPVTVKRLSLELQQIRSFAASNGRTFSVKGIESKRKTLYNHIHQDRIHDHKTVLEEILSKYNKLLDACKKANATSATVSIDQEFLKKCRGLVVNAKLRVRTEFLAGPKK